MKYHVEKNSMQETPVIRLFGLPVCSGLFAAQFSDPEEKRICDAPDYGFAER